MRSKALVLASAAAAWLAAVGCGGFSSGGAPGLEPPAPPEFAQPDQQGAVVGRIRVAGAVLTTLVRELDLRVEVDEKPDSPDPGGTPDAPGGPEEGGSRTSAAAPTAPARSRPAGERDVYASMVAELVGTRRSRQAEVGVDGSFRVDVLPRGDYTLSVRLADRTLASFPVPVRERETVEIDFEVLGFDWADLDGDGSTRDLAVRVEVNAGKVGADATRVVMPDGTVRVRLANGGVEYLLPGGLVRREEPGKGASFRADHDLDGIPDADDRDYRRLRTKPTPPDEAALLAGDAFPPLVREASVTGPYGGPPHDLARFTARLSRDFTRAATEVRAGLFGRGKPPANFALRDDGGAVDLLPEWPGHQPSGDLVAGDGVYSHLLPVDPTTYGQLFDRQVVVVAKDAAGKPSNRFTFFLYGDGPPPTRRVAADPLWRAIRGVDLESFSDNRGPQVRARLELDASRIGAVATLVGPRDFRRVLAPSEELAPQGRLRMETRPAPMPADGLYFLVVGAPDGSVFYAGKKLSREP